MKFYNLETYSEVDTETLQLIPNMTPIPVYTDIDVVKQAVSDILHVLKNSAKSNLPTVLKGDAIQNAFKKIADLLENNEALPSPILEKSPKNSQQKIVTPEPRVQYSLPVPPVSKMVKNSPTSPKPRVMQKNNNQSYQQPSPPFQTPV